MKRTRAVKENTRLKKEYGELLAEVIGLRAKLRELRFGVVHVQHKDGKTHVWGVINQDIVLHDEQLAFCSPEDLDHPTDGTWTWKPEESKLSVKSNISAPNGENSAGLLSLEQPPEETATIVIKTLNTGVKPCELPLPGIPLDRCPECGSVNLKPVVGEADQLVCSDCRWPYNKPLPKGVPP